MAGVSNSDNPVGSFAANAEMITKSDTMDFVGPVSIVCFDGTEVKVKTLGGQVVTIPVIAGLPIPVKVLRVYATGTSATKILGVW